MSEPRYDFCLAVLRKNTALGFRIEYIFLVYVPDLPQQAHERKKWISKQSTFDTITDQIKRLCGYTVMKRGAKSSKGYVHLWAIVPMLSVTNESIIKRVSHSRGFPGAQLEVLSDTHINTYNLSDFFNKLCNDLHKHGGGRYLRKRGEKEVPRYVV